MVQRVSTVAFEGIEARAVDVQVQVAPGLPAFAIVGLPDKAVGEARERVRAALFASGLALPARRITVNLAPADVQKEGSHFDLPIALGMLASDGVLAPEELAIFTVVGELALTGALTPVTGVLPAAVAASARSGSDLPGQGGAVRPLGRCGVWDPGERFAAGAHRPLLRANADHLSRPAAEGPGGRRQPTICAESRARSLPSARWKSRRRAA